MFMFKCVAFYGLVFIAATDAFPGMIPNFARDDAPISDSQPIQLSSGGGETATSLLAHTPSPALPLDPSATPSAASLSTPAATATVPETDMTGGSVTVSTPGIPTMTQGLMQKVQRRKTATGSPARVAFVPPGGLFEMA